MWSRHADGIDLLELNRRAQMLGSRMMHLFFLEIRALLPTHSTARIHPFLLGDPETGSIDARTRAVVRHENQPLN
jgi:hypothetical protein